MSREKQLRKFNEFIEDSEYTDELKKVHINEFIEHLKGKLNDYEKSYLVDYPFNYEFIKLSQFHLNEIFNSCIYKTLMNKRDTQTLTKEFLDMNYMEIPELIYKSIWELVRLRLREIVKSTKNLNDLSSLGSINMKYEANIYRSREMLRYDKLRYLYKFTSRFYNDTFIGSIARVMERTPLLHWETAESLIYSLYIHSTKSDNLDEETKRRFYNELNKFWLNIISVAYDDAMIYFILDKKLKKSALKVKKKNLYNILFHRKC